LENFELFKSISKHFSNIQAIKKDIFWGILKRPQAANWPQISRNEPQALI
jgi:hypothetical protein